MFYSTAFSLDVFCLIDLRTIEDIGSSLVNMLPFDSYYFVPAQGQCGGICLFWKTRSININVVFPHHRFVHCFLIDLSTDKSWYTTFVYAYPNKSLQRGLWNEIANLKPTNNQAWNLMGDLTLLKVLVRSLVVFLPPLLIW